MESVLYCDWNRFMNPWAWNPFWQVWLLTFPYRSLPLRLYIILFSPQPWRGAGLDSEEGPMIQSDLECRDQGRSVTGPGKDSDLSVLTVADFVNVSVLQKVLISVTLQASWVVVSEILRLILKCSLCCLFSKRHCESITAQLPILPWSCHPNDESPVSRLRECGSWSEPSYVTTRSVVSPYVSSCGLSLTIHSLNTSDSFHHSILYVKLCYFFQGCIWCGICRFPG